MSARPELDVARVLDAVASRDVDFVVVGGIAAVLHGSARNTNDIDLCFATEAENLERLGAALIALGARLRGAPPDLPFVPDAAMLRRIRVLTMTTEAGDLDVLVEPAGFPGYAALRERAEIFELGGHRVRVASIEDLMGMKRASARPKDLADLAELEAIARLRAAGA